MSLEVWHPRPRELETFFPRKKNNTRNFNSLPESNASCRVCLGSDPSDQSWKLCAVGNPKFRFKLRTYCWSSFGKFMFWAFVASRYGFFSLLLALSTPSDMSNCLSFDFAAIQFNTYKLHVVYCCSLGTHHNSIGRWRGWRGKSQNHIGSW